MKTCTKCNETKELTEFVKDKQKKDGLRSSCKTCAKPYRRAHYEANREAILEQTAAYTAANREAMSEWQAAHYKANRTALLEQQAAYYEANAATIKAKDAKRSCGKAAPSWLSDSHHEAILCVYEVADALDYHVDHIVPRSHPLVSGLHVPANLQALPASDNSRKKNYLPLDPEYSFIHQHDGRAYDSATGQLVPTT
jgi:5-methylcytosine-specific restriction endonuclease McrA